MLKSRILTGALITAAVALTSMFAAAPASAATLPAGQKISVIDSYEGQFYFAGPETAALTAVGVPAGPVVLEGDVLAGTDVDDNGLGYAIGNAFNEGSPSGSSLYAADAATGVLTYVQSIRFFFAPDSLQNMDSCTGIDYTGGNLLLACLEFERDEVVEAYIGRWDFALGWAVPLIELTGDPELDPGEANPNEPPNSFDYREITAIAVDPVGGKLWVFTSEYGDGILFGIYTASQDAGLTAVSNSGEYEVYAADFDRGGQLWVSTYRDYGQITRVIDPGEIGLATLNPNTGAFPFTAAWPNQEQYLGALTVWGKQILPATGPASPVLPTAAAALLLLTGTILAGVTILRRRSFEA